MRRVVIQTAEADSTGETSERMVKTLDRNYSKAPLRQVVNASQMNDDARTLLLSLLEDFEYLFDGTLGNWATNLLT